MTLGRKLLAYMSPGLAVAMLSGFALLIALDIFCNTWVISLESRAAMIIFEIVQNVMLGIGVSSAIFMVFRAMSWQSQPKTKNEAFEKAQNYFWTYVGIAGLALIWTLVDNPQLNSIKMGRLFLGLIIGGFLVSVFTAFYSLKYQLPPLHDTES